VTQAEKLFDELRRRHPDEPARVLWRRVYRETIEGYDSLDKLARRDAEQQLRLRVQWRRRAETLPKDTENSRLSFPLSCGAVSWQSQKPEKV
jgi:hypothetical protein